MHILHLIEYFAPRIGGVENHVLHLCRELALQGHRVSVVARMHAPGLPVRERLGPIEVRRLPMANPNGFTGRPAWRLLLPHLDLLRSADLVHVHDHTPFFRYYLPFRLLLPRTPVFLTFHGHEGNFPPARRDVLARRAAARLVRGTLCVGHYVEKWYGTRGYAVTYGAVTAPGPDGRESGGGQPTADDRAGSGPAAPNATLFRQGLPLVPQKVPEPGPPAQNAILFLGRLEPDTGILAFLQGLALVQRRDGLRPGLVVCGGGSLEGQVRDFAARESLEVAFQGVVEDPRPWVRGSRFVLASGYLSMLEGMICGRLVFGYHDNALRRDYWGMLPGAREMMILCGSPEEWAQRYQEILARPDLEASLTERASDFARLQSWERLAGLYLDLYRSVAAAGPHVRRRDGAPRRSSGGAA